MAVSQAKITWFFEAVQRAGWTESFYFPTSTLEGVLPTTPFLTSGYAFARLALLSSAYYMTAIRVTQAADYNPRQSHVIEVAEAFGQGTFAPGTGDPTAGEQPFDSLLCRIEAGPGHRRGFRLGGLPEGILTGSALYKPTAAWNTAFNRWAAIIPAAIPYNIQGVVRAPAIQAASYAVDAAGRTITVTFPNATTPAGYVSGARVAISGARGIVGVNGMWRIEFGSTIGVIYMYPRPKQTIYGTASGTLATQLITNTYTPITSVQPERGVRKNAGRPFDLLAGRRKARAI